MTYTISKVASFAPTTRAFCLLVALMMALTACGSEEPTGQLPDCREVVIIQGADHDAGMEEPEEQAQAQAPIERPTKPRKLAPIEEDAAKPKPIAKKAAQDHDDEPEEDTPQTLHSNLEVVDNAMATAIKDREPVGVADHFTTDDKVLWAWIKVKNHKDPSQITMVWRHEGKERSRITLDVGTSPRWRTWSRKSIGKNDTGKWTLHIYAPNGDTLYHMNFRVQAPTAVAAGA